MGSIFKRKGTRFWWLGFTDSTGKRRLISSETEDEKVARKLLEKLERRVDAERESGVATGPLTVERYATELWLPARQARGISTVDKDEDCLAHVFPQLGRTRLEKVTRQDVLLLVRGLTSKGELAPRTIRHVYATLRVLFADALAEGFVTNTPCTLLERRGELPAKRDKNPLWRMGAVYTREEVEWLISDARIPEWRRTLWALVFLTGSRINEVTARRWRDWDTEARPLGRLLLGSRWDMRNKKERAATKTGVSREVPVHPALAAVLASWKLGGWARYRGQPPGPEDLLMPSPYRRKAGDPSGDMLSAKSTLRRLEADCAMLGIRKRDQHSMRRTFISLCIADGAREDILRRVTHDGRSTVVDLYKVLPWDSLCNEVLRLRVTLRKGEVRTLQPLLQPSGRD